MTLRDCVSMVMVLGLLLLVVGGLTKSYDLSGLGFILLVIGILWRMRFEMNPKV